MPVGTAVAPQLEEPDANNNGGKPRGAKDDGVENGQTSEHDDRGSNRVIECPSFEPLQKTHWRQSIRTTTQLGRSLEQCSTISYRTS